MSSLKEEISLTEFDEENKNKKIKSITDNENNEIIEELEQSDTKEELIEKRRKSKKNTNKLLNNKIFIFILINLIFLPLLYILFLNYKNNNIVVPKTKFEASSNPKSSNKLQDINLKLKFKLNNTNDFQVESIAQFPSGKIISADWISIKIYDNDYNIKQKIDVYEVIDKRCYWKTQKRIYKIVIKDEDNFAIYANDGVLKLFTKIGDKFELKQEIDEVEIVHVIFQSNGRLIACCRRNLIKIFELNEKGVYKSIKSLSQADSFDAALFEDKNILVSKEIASMQFYDVSNNYKKIGSLRERSVHELERYGNDKFIIYHNSSLKIISISERKLVKTIKIGFEAFSTKYIEEKGIILVGGIERNNKGSDKGILLILNSDNFEILKKIYDIHGTCVRSINILKNGLIATYGDDKNDNYPIKIWTLE